MCLIEDQSWIDCIDITSRWDTFVLFHLYGNKGVSLPLWPIRPRWFHTFSPCAEPLGDGHEGMGARFGSQGSIALNWHSRYSGTRYSGTWLYIDFWSYINGQYHVFCMIFIILRGKELVLSTKCFYWCYLIWSKTKSEVLLHIGWTIAGSITIVLRGILSTLHENAGWYYR